MVTEDSIAVTCFNPYRFSEQLHIPLAQNKQCVQRKKIDDAMLFPSEGLGEDLSKYVAETWPDGVVRIVRTNERSGLIRARLAGARAATGDVLIFLDSHCEAAPGWWVVIVICTLHFFISHSFFLLEEKPF